MVSKFLDAAGSRYGDFVVTKCRFIEEIGALLRELSHLPSGAKIMHIGNEDPENLFCLSFQTLPSSSNGIAHILEHTVLCGSEKFPVKDPFFAMNRRSLNTFMNALTGSDFTCYPAATQVEKDFYNLLTVYLDAVFHPKLLHLSFLQEGHRFEFATPTDPKTDLVSKGIVFNEMKGSLASAENRLWHLLLEQLLPDLPYAFNSGGNPKEIPKLTYEELRLFHQTYYHPSRCLFFFYGNLSLKGHLDFLLEHALRGIPPLPPLPKIPLQRRFSHPIIHTASYPTGAVNEEEQTMIAWGFLTVASSNQEELLALGILDNILMDSDASLLKQELLDSKLCIQADAYIDPEMSEVPYMLICKGCKEEDADALENVLQQALEKIIERGIDQRLIDAAIHQLEFSRLEITGDQAPFGLTLFMRAALAQQHGGDPEHTLTIYSLFEKLHVTMSDRAFIEKLIRKHFLSNPHRVRLTFKPDPKLGAQEAHEELRFLEKKKRSLTEKEIQSILHQTQELASYQKMMETQSIECLPKILLSDVPPLAKNIPLKKSISGSTTLFHHACFTNHILYADLHCDLPHLSLDELSMAQFLVSILPEIGCGTRNYKENLNYIQAYTGGIGSSLLLHIQTDDSSLCNPSILLKGKALKRHQDHLLSLFYDMMQKAHYDDPHRIGELIAQIAHASQQRLSRQGLRYATQLALSGFSEAAYISEIWQGIHYFHFIKELHKRSKRDIGGICHALTHLKEKVLSGSHPHLVVSSGEESFCNLSHSLAKLPPLSSTSITPWQGGYSPQKVISQGRIIPSPVAFSVEAFATRSYLHRYAPSLMLASFLLENTTLHPEIREKGGAYGSGATYMPQTGHFYFYALRDPQIAATWRTFHIATEKIASLDFSERDLEEAKIGVIQAFDAPISPGQRGATAYNWLRSKKTLEERQAFRDALLRVSRHDIAQAVDSELISGRSSAVFVTCAEKHLLEKENRFLKSEGKELPLFEI